MITIGIKLAIFIIFVEAHVLYLYSALNDLLQLKQYQ
jgi:hypothetical protein